MLKIEFFVINQDEILLCEWSEVKVAIPESASITRTYSGYLMLSVKQRNYMQPKNYKQFWNHGHMHGHIVHETFWKNMNDQESLNHQLWTQFHTMLHEPERYSHITSPLYGLHVTGRSTNVFSKCVSIVKLSLTNLFHAIFCPVPCLTVSHLTLL